MPQHYNDKDKKAKKRRSLLGTGAAGRAADAIKDRERRRREQMIRMGLRER